MIVGCLSEMTCGPVCEGKPGEPRLIGIVLTSAPFWKICICSVLPSALATQESWTWIVSVRSVWP